MVIRKLISSAIAGVLLVSFCFGPATMSRAVDTIPVTISISETPLEQPVVTIPVQEVEEDKTEATKKNESKPAKDDKKKKKSNKKKQEPTSVKEEPKVKVDSSTVKTDVKKEYSKKSKTEVKNSSKRVKKSKRLQNLSEKDIDLIALVTMAEAENQSELGKRLVIDVVLNRIESDRFANTARGVIYAKNQFTSMTNGRSDRCYVKKSIRKLVIEEIESRTNTKVLYFRSGRYHGFGTPVCKEDDHYFSTY